MALGRERIDRLRVRVLERIVEVALKPLRVSVGRVARRNTQPDPLLTRSL
jgi:hypothetical protein